MYEMEVKLSISILSSDNKTDLCDITKLSCLLKVSSYNTPHEDHTNWGPVLGHLKTGFQVLFLRKAEQRFLAGSWDTMCKWTTQASTVAGRQEGSSLPQERAGDTKKKLHCNTLASTHAAVGKWASPFFVSAEELLSATDGDSRVVEIKQADTSTGSLFSVA